MQKIVFFTSHFISVTGVNTAFYPFPEEHQCSSGHRDTSDSTRGLLHCGQSACRPRSTTTPSAEACSSHSGPTSCLSRRPKDLWTTSDTVPITYLVMLSANSYTMPIHVQRGDELMILYYMRSHADADSRVTWAECQGWIEVACHACRRSTDPPSAL